MSSSSSEFWSVPDVDKISDFLNRVGKNLGVQYALLAVLFIRVSWGMCETLQLEIRAPTRKRRWNSHAV